MIKSPVIRPKEGLVFYRLMMVLGSLSPLFVLLAVRGVPVFDGRELIPHNIFVAICIAFAIVPSLAILARLIIVKARNDARVITVGSATDSREHLLVYLFALLIPMYQNSYSSVRDVRAALLLLLLIVFVLYNLNLHYLNVLFAFFGYRVYTVETETDGNPFSGRYPFIILSKRQRMQNGTQFRAYRISDNVYIEL